LEWIAVRLTRFLTLLAAFVLLGPSQASSEQMANDLIHSDLPLFGDDTANKWPRPFHDDDTFGCATRVSFGDWVLREPRASGGGDAAEWFKVRNYGVFHCWAMVARAHGRHDLEGAELRPSFFVFLETARIGDTEAELWAVQIGARPGSEYLLLSRPQTAGMIKAYNVLQTECPSANIRDTGAIDIILTRYCSINTQADLVGLARLMAQRPFRGTLSLVEENGSDDAGDESRE
jgi:hypothetical protein